MLGAFWEHRDGEWQALGTLGDSSLLSVLPAAHSPARPLLPLTKHFSFPSGAFCNWNGTSEIVLLFKSRSLNSHIYLESHTNLNLLGTVEILTQAVPNPQSSFNCKQRGFVPRVSHQAGLGEHIHPSPQRQPLGSRTRGLPSLSLDTDRRTKPTTWLLARSSAPAPGIGANRRRTAARRAYSKDHAGASNH